MIELRTILCPVDFSENSQHAIGYAVAFAKTHQARLVLLHVLQPPVFGAGADGLGVDLPEDYLEAVERHCRQQLDALVARTAGEDLRVDGLIAGGVPFVEILQCARTEKADLIVMGTHGRTGIAHALIGSAAERVVRKAPCPVLTVKHPPPQA